MPILTSSKIWLAGNCKIYFEIKNNGPGKLRNSAYALKNGVTIKMYKNNNPWGGIKLGAVDTGKALVNPGGTITHKWFPNNTGLKLLSGKHLLRVVIDNKNVVKEKNELNNSLSKELNCKSLALVDQKKEFFITQKSPLICQIQFGNNEFVVNNEIKVGIEFYNPESKKTDAAAVKVFLSMTDMEDKVFTLPPIDSGDSGSYNMLRKWSTPGEKVITVRIGSSRSTNMCSVPIRIR